MKKIRNLISIIILALLLVGCKEKGIPTRELHENADSKKEITTDTFPDYQGEPYVIMNHNEPDFSEEERKMTNAFEQYSELDSLGRPGVAFANICQELMPTEKRGEIGHIKPVGWHFAKYDIVDGKYLYNRCHLVGYQLAGENANEKNLMTGTRYMNVEGMEPFENMVADYVKDSGNHVLYRVTPVYQESNLLASGVQMEGYSVEDEGKGICFHVYVFNAQPGVEIDYKSGESHLKDDYESTTETVADMESEHSEIQEYILNMNTKKFHRPFCDSVKDMKEKNKKSVRDYRENIMKEGYQPCKRCNP